MRKWIVAGNWKMHNTVAEAVALADAIKKGVSELKNGEVVVAPPFTALAAVGTPRAVAGTGGDRPGFTHQCVLSQGKGAVRTR